MDYTATHQHHACLPEHYVT